MSLSKFGLVFVILMMILICAYKWSISNSAEFIPVDGFIVRPYWNQCQWDMLLNLNNILWPNIQFAAIPAGQLLANGERYRASDGFEVRISLGQRELFIRLMNLFVDLMFQHGLGDRFFLKSSTLVGSYRHHDMVPWDDDVDIIADLNLRMVITKLLNDNIPNDCILVHAGPRDKLYTMPMLPDQEPYDLRMGRKTSDQNWSWPFLDINYYHSNETHIWEYNVVWSKETVFPLLFRPFGKFWYPTPIKMFQFLNKTIRYDDRCLRNGWDHYLQKPGIEKFIPCESLQDKHTFVHRSISNFQPSSSFDHPNIDMSQMVIAREVLWILTPRKQSMTRIFHTIHVLAHRDDVTMDPLSKDSF